MSLMHHESAYIYMHLHTHASRHHCIDLHVCVCAICLHVCKHICLHECLSIYNVYMDVYLSGVSIYMSQTCVRIHASTNICIISVSRYMYVSCVRAIYASRLYLDTCHLSTCMSVSRYMYVYTRYMYVYV